MSDLINRNDIYKLFEHGIAKLHVSDIDVIPTIDAVEVVRCHECRNYTVDCYCSVHDNYVMYDNDFCSYGKRKEIDE